MCCFVTILYVAMSFCFERCFLQEYSIRNGHRGRFRRLDLIAFSTIFPFVWGIYLNSGRCDIAHCFHALSLVYLVTIHYICKLKTGSDGMGKYLIYKIMIRSCKCIYILAHCISSLYERISTDCFMTFLSMFYGSQYVR